MRIAITRQVSASIAECLLTFQAREPIDVDLARKQHLQYEACLADIGCRIERLPEEPELPDAVFVEDAAVVLKEVAIIMHPGAEARRAETITVEEKLRNYRRLLRIEPPGTMDGGDVLCVAKLMFVGLSGRSNEAGIAQMRGLLEPLGYRVHTVEIKDCLHLKATATQVANNTLLIDPKWVDPALFEGFEVIETDPAEHHAANALLVGETVVYSAAHARTRQRLEKAGITVRIVDVSELAKAEAGVTCCSLIFDA